MISRLTRSNAVLWICDVQTRLLPEMWEAQRVERNVALLARFARLVEIPVIVTEQNPEKLGHTADSIREALGPCPAVSKMSFSGWTSESKALLEETQRKTVLLCGLESHICVTQTALALRENEYDVFAAWDAISSRQEGNRKIGWERMRSVGVMPSSTEAALYELMGEAGTDEFRAVLGWVK